MAASTSRSFDLYVLDGRSKKAKLRKSGIVAKDENAAVRSYVVSKNRPKGSRLGVAISAKGKKFEAVPAGAMPTIGPVA